MTTRAIPDSGRTSVFMPRTTLILVVAIVSTFGLLASDVYVPAMPAMATEFGIARWQMPQTVSIYLIVLAVAQLICGPLSERWGRKPVLVAGILVYIVSSIGCAFVAGFTGFLLWRMLQGAGAAAGLVIGRAVIADTCDKKASAKVYNIVYPLVLLSPALAPAIGAHLAARFGWRADFLFVAAFGALALVLTWTLLPETRRATGIADTPFSGLTVVLKDRGFVRYTIVVCAIYSAWFVYLTQSPFLFDRLGLTQTQAGWLYLPLTCGIIGANLIARRLLDRLRYDTIVALGVGAFVLGGCAFLFTAGMGLARVSAIVLPMLLVSLANGSSMSLAVSAAIAGGHGRAATASGLIGFFQIGSASLAASGAATMFGTGQRVLAVSVFLLSLIAVVAVSGRLKEP